MAASALDKLLEKAAVHAASFKRDFVEVVAAETYHQRLVETAGKEEDRLIESEMFFIALNNEGDTVHVRRVLTVDGRRVPSVLERYERALSMPRRDARRALLTLANEGARYNLGDLARNFSDSTLALLFVSDERRERFKFKRAGTEVIDGETITRVTFDERERPTLIRDGRTGGNVPASGTLFIDADGVVQRSELTLSYGTIKASLRVRYKRDEQLGIHVPVVMDEEYRFRTGFERRPARIVTHAEYSNYRRFRTSGRIVAP
jgi:hypothetical protein